MVGYSFRDDNIRGLFLDTVKKNPKLKICLIDPAADEIVANRLDKIRNNIYQIPYKLGLDTWAGLEKFGSQ